MLIVYFVMYFFENYFTLLRIKYFIINCNDMFNGVEDEVRKENTKYNAKISFSQCFVNRIFFFNSETVISKVNTRKFFFKIII